jgi:hypothetical protein
MMINLKQQGFRFALAGVFALGAYLRLHGLAAQILLDDEWHNLIQVLGKNAVRVLTQFNPHDNASLPLALYNLAVYHLFGWSEFTLRLPLILAGLLSLVGLPLLVRKNFNERVALIFASLLALSPFLIFYSRYARAYGLVMLLCFAAWFWFCAWLTTGKRPYAAGFALAGILAVYSHPAALVAVAVPLMTVLACKLPGRFWGPAAAGRQSIVPLKALLTLALVLTLLILPLMLQMFQVSDKLPWGKGVLTLDGVLTAATLLSGTVNLPLNILFFLLCALGFKWMFQHQPLLGWMGLTTACAYVVVLLVSRPLGLDNGEVLLRYLIVLVPMVLLSAALGMEGLLRRVQNWKNPGRCPAGLPVVVVLGCLYAAGPLPALRVSPNNFSNHAAFQGSYRRHTWSSSEAGTVYPSLSIHTNQIPPFYFWLAGQSNLTAIIEYPFEVCDFNNLFYYYQHFHQKRVIAGYCRNYKLLGCDATPAPEPGSSTAAAGAMLSADTILSCVPDRTKLTFHNMVNILDLAAMNNSPAGVIVLHKYILALNPKAGAAEGTTPSGRIQEYYRSVKLLRDPFQQAFGPPVYEDEQMVCFWVHAVPPAK